MLYDFFRGCDVRRIVKGLHETRLEGLYRQFSNASLREQAVRG